MATDAECPQGLTLGSKGSGHTVFYSGLVGAHVEDGGRRGGRPLAIQVPGRYPSQSPR